MNIINNMNNSFSFRKITASNLPLWFILSSEIFFLKTIGARGGGTDLERGYGDVRPWRPPFHACPAARKGPISSQRVSSQDPLLRKFGNFSLNILNFHPNFSSQAPKFGNFQLTSPQIWKFSAHKPPNLEFFRSQAPLFRGKCQFASPTLRKSWPHTPTWKKLSAPPGGFSHQNRTWMCLPDLENLTISIPIFCQISHPSVYHFWKKSTQFGSNWVLFTIICPKYTQFM